MKFLKIVKSKYCWLVMIISIILSYFLVLKDIHSLNSWYIVLLSIVYSLLFSFSNACLVKDIVERVKNRNRLGHKSFVSIFASILGYGAFQTCIVGYSCTTPLLFTVFPLTISSFLVHHGVWLLLIADVLLFFSVYRQKCFRKN